MEERRLFCDPNKIFYALKLLLKFIVMAVAVFAGTQLSQPNFGEVLRTVDKLHQNPIQFLRDCAFVCKNETALPVLNGNPELTF